MWRKGRTLCVGLSRRWRVRRRMPTANLRWADLNDRPEAMHAFQCRREDYECVYLCSQAIVLEGSYWKRRIEVVIKEYHKWRIYYKKRVSNWPNIMGQLCMILWWYTDSSYNQRSKMTNIMPKFIIQHVRYPSNCWKFI